jgi:hypothetical protein
MAYGFPPRAVAAPFSFCPLKGNRPPPLPPFGAALRENTASKGSQSSIGALSLYTK